MHLSNYCYWRLVMSKNRWNRYTYLPIGTLKAFSLFRVILNFLCHRCLPFIFLNFNRVSEYWVQKAALGVFASICFILLFLAELVGTESGAISRQINYNTRVALLGNFRFLKPSDTTDKLLLYEILKEDLMGYKECSYIIFPWSNNDMHSLKN